MNTSVDPLANRALFAPAPERRPRGARLTTVAALLALGLSIYALVRIDATRDRLDSARDALHTTQSSQEGLRADFAGSADRNERFRQEIAAQLETLKPLPQQVTDLNATLDEVRGRAEGPTRAWSRTEALFLLELAQRRLTFARDVDTATAALQAADSDLASLHDASVTEVRREIAAEIGALRALTKPDLTGLMARLAAAETRSAQLKLRGLLQGQRSVAADNAPLPADGSSGNLGGAQGGSDSSSSSKNAGERASALVKHTLFGLLTIRRVDERSGEIVTLEEQALRRQHLQMLLFGARQAVLRGDAPAYRDNLQQARRWLEQYFDTDDKSVTALRNDLNLLAQVDISPPLPDISASAQLLQHITAAPRAQ